MSEKIEKSAEEQQPAKTKVNFLKQWFDASAEPEWDETTARKINWFRVFPYVLIHLACFLAFLPFVGISWTAVGVCFLLYFIRMYLVTGWLHRYFSHRSFKTSRILQFIMAWGCCTTMQRGPLWWAAHHRHHHKFSDQEPDLHSPSVRGFLMSHMGWFLTNEAWATRMELVPDWAKFKELVWINRYEWVPALSLLITLWVAGDVLNYFFPGLQTNGAQLAVWGFVISTILLYHGTYTINSLTHRFGRKRYETGDDSRNSFILSLVTLGEGWHNNHHHYPASCRQGFYWWEIDITYYILIIMNKLGLVWDIRPVTDKARMRNRVDGKSLEEDTEPAKAAGLSSADLPELPSLDDIKDSLKPKKPKVV